MYLYIKYGLITKLPSQTKQTNLNTSLSSTGTIIIHHLSQITMKIALCLFLNLMAFPCFLVFATNATVQEEKAETAIPVTALSPPEGNTTFLGGTTWCVARPGSSPVYLQIALDWACGSGRADCSPIQPGGQCFEPNSLLSHASYAFNDYYQKNGNSDIACYFGRTAGLTQNNPSYAKCVYSTSESIRSLTAASSSRSLATGIVWKINVILVLIYFGRR